MNIEDYYIKALNTVADVTGITVEDIKGKCRLRYLVDARCMVIMLLQKEDDVEEMIIFASISLSERLTG